MKGNEGTDVNYRNTLRDVCFILILLAFVFPRDVHAYLDPGTGSLVFQTVVAALAAAAYGLRTYWSRIRMLLGRRDSGTESGDRQG
jgi:O-antigen/teichoic acid export membrane protein